MGKFLQLEVQARSAIRIMILRKSTIKWSILTQKSLRSKQVRIASTIFKKAHLNPKRIKLKIRKKWILIMAQKKRSLSNHYKINLHPKSTTWTPLKNAWKIPTKLGILTSNFNLTMMAMPNQHLLSRKRGIWFLITYKIKKWTNKNLALSTIRNNLNRTMTITYTATTTKETLTFCLNLTLRNSTKMVLLKQQKIMGSFQWKANSTSNRDLLKVSQQQLIK